MFLAASKHPNNALNIKILASTGDKGSWPSKEPGGIDEKGGTLGRNVSEYPEN
jgi:hypothetical protein